MIFLPGGPSHIDLVDLKPDAPAEIRGEFRPIATNVPGIDTCEHLPCLARVMDKIALIRSISGAVDDHACHMCYTGHPRLGPQPGGGWPNVGSVVSGLLGPTDPRVPPFAGLAATMIHPPYNDPGRDSRVPRMRRSLPTARGIPTPCSIGSRWSGWIAGGLCCPVWMTSAVRSTGERLRASTPFSGRRWK